MTPRLYRTDISPLPWLLAALLSLMLTAVAARGQDELVGPNPLAPVKTDSPRDTFTTYQQAMEAYVRGLAGNDKIELSRLDDAIRCFDLHGLTPLARRDQGRESAILLKEVLDRVIRVDLEKVPDTAATGTAALKRWRLRNTEITIVLIGDGDRAGEYLFSADTVERLPDFYQRVRHLPYLAGLTGAGYTRPWMETKMPDWAGHTVVLFANWQWLGLFAAILLGLLAKTVAQYALLLSKRVTRRTRHRWDHDIVTAIERPTGLTVAGLLWLFAVHVLRFDGSALAVLSIAAQVVVGIGLIWACYGLSDVLAAYLKEVTGRTESTLDDQLVPLVRKSMKVFVVVFGVLVLVQNMGVNVLSLLAGLGLGGLAFALAAKDTCANLFGSIMILLDRPFQIGDWVIIGPLEGSIEEIGFRSTRIRTFYDSQISVPNATVANANIDNMGRRNYRRIKTFFGIAYNTPPEKLEAFLEGIKNIVKANPYTRKDYYHVVFNSYEDTCLSVMLYCFLKVPDWSTELVERQNIYLEIHRLAHSLGVEFAFPTQTLHVASTPEHPAATPVYDVPQLAATAAAFAAGGLSSHPAGQGIFTPPHKDQSTDQPLRGESGE